MSREEHLENFRSLLNYLGEDHTRDGLIRTPHRHMKSLEFLTQGYNTNIDEIINQALFDVDYSDMVIVKDIEFYSLCEHHVLPFYGKCHIAYIPNGKVVGLSKIPRVVNAFARRLQVQERMTNQIASALFEHLKPEGVGIICQAYHMCMMMRGVEKQDSYTITSSMQGVFRNSETRQEFLSLINHK